MRVLCLVDGRVDPPDRWMWNYLSPQAQRDEVDFMHAETRDLFPKWGKLLTYYPAYWILAVRALRQSRKGNYDVIVAWESKNGLALALLRRLLGVTKPKLVILAFTYKGIAMHFPFLGRLAMRGVDHLTVPSHSEVGYYGHMLDFPLDRMTVSPLGWYDMATKLDIPAGVTGDYVFAGGRSGRDYGTLFQAMSGLEGRLVVNARRFNVRRIKPPPNVAVQGFMPMLEYYTLMASARFVVLPLHDVPHATGLGHIVQAMSAGKALIATRTASTVDYVDDGRTGILVAPYDVQQMRDAISHLLDHPEEAQEMGRLARQRYEQEYTFAALAERTYGVLARVVKSE